MVFSIPRSSISDLRFQIISNLRFAERFHIHKQSEIFNLKS